MNYISLEIDRKLGSLHYAMDIAVRIGADLVRADVVSEEWVDDLQLVVSEACTNAIKHSGDLPGNNRIVVEFDIADEALCIEVREQGKGFSLDDIRPPDLDKPQGYGLGLFLIRQKTDQVSYQQDGSWNILRIVKRF